MKKLFAALALAMVAPAFPAVAQQPAAPPQSEPQSACLQNNRIWEWNAVNDRLLIVTDRLYHRYIVRLNGGCIGLSAYALAALRFRSWESLGCLRHGDQVIYRAPGLGRLNCFIDEVQPYSDALLAQVKDATTKKN